MKKIWNDPRSLFNGNHFSSKMSMRVQQCVRYARSLSIMVRAISVYSAGVPYAARFTAAVKIPLPLATFQF